VEVPAGSTAEGATTINGSVTVGEGAKVGETATVNGGIHLGEHSTVNSARTVNGGIDVGEGARIMQDVDAVNGGIRLAKGADVGGTVKNVNGGIRLDSAHVAKGISTFTGDIEVGHGSRVEGGIHVQKPDFGNDMNRTPRVVVGADSVVQGTLKFDRDVKLLVSDTAKIGPVEGATVQLFSGDDPNHVIEPAAAADAAAAVETPADGASAKPADKPGSGSKAAPAAGAAQKQ
jgi:acetyltransferase-like isoleucine patch superfamily enzyme